MTLRIGIIGSTGNIGKALREEIASDKKFSYSYGIHKKNAHDKDFLKLSEVSDVLIDFSSPELLEKILQSAQDFSRPLVIGTTGFSYDQFEEIKKAAMRIPLFYSPNFSMGIFCLKKILKILSAFFSENCSIDLMEWHRAQKKDRPSGTALSLIEEIQKHTSSVIHTSSIRAGDTFCEHSVFFTKEKERITVKHEIYDKATFAKVALKAAAFLLGRPIGYYSMENLAEQKLCLK